MKKLHTENLAAIKKGYKNCWAITYIISHTGQKFFLKIGNWLCSDKGLTLQTSALETLYSGQRTLSTQLIKLNHPIIPLPMQHHCLFENFPFKLSILHSF